MKIKKKLKYTEVMKIKETKDNQDLTVVSPIDNDSIDYIIKWAAIYSEIFIIYSICEYLFTF